MSWFKDIAKVVRLMDIRAGAPMPDGYGIAYIRRSSMMYVLYPIPFNHLMRFLVKIWDALLFILYTPTMQEELIGKAFELGVDEALRRVDEKNKKETQGAIEFLKNSGIFNIKHGGESAIPKERLQ